MNFAGTFLFKSTYSPFPLDLSSVDNGVYKAFVALSCFLADNNDGMFIGWAALVDTTGVCSLESCILVLRTTLLLLFLQLSASNFAFSFYVDEANGDYHLTLQATLKAHDTQIS